MKLQVSASFSLFLALSATCLAADPVPSTAVAASPTPLAASTSAPLVQADPCEDALSASNFITKTIASFLSAPQTDRIRTICELRDAVAGQYSLFDLKKERITNPDGTPFDSLAHLNQCVQIEKSITNDDSDLHFIDRVTQCIAGFHDTHFWTATPMPIPAVYTGFFVRSIDGKYYISSTIPNMLSYTEVTAADPDEIAELKTALAVGNEVVSVDDQTPASLVAHYSSYISGSSPDFIRLQAERAIFYRNFDYPTKNSVKVTLKDPSGGMHYLELPWWGAIQAHSRGDAMEYFQKLGIPLNDRIKIALSLISNQPDWRTVQLQATGYDDSKALFPVAGLQEYLDDTGAPGLRTAEVDVPKGPSFCYMELLTFETANFKLGSVTQPFADTLREFIEECGNKHLNLVLDLRSNPGGNGDLPDVVLSLLTPPNMTLPAPVMALRVTDDTGKLVSSADFASEITIKDLGKLVNSPLDVFESAVAAGQMETDIIPNVTLGADAKEGGYSGAILVLVTPNCVSACDMTASLLKKSGRAFFVGTHSNGTGAGFYASDTLDSSFSDSQKELALKIPNFMFGVPDKVLDPSATVSYSKYKDSYLLENRPTLADAQYDLTIDDLNPQSPGAGWQSIVIQVMGLAGQAPAPATAAAAAPAAQ